MRSSLAIILEMLRNRLPRGAVVRITRRTITVTVRRLDDVDLIPSDLVAISHEVAVQPRRIVVGARENIDPHPLLPEVIHD